MKLLPGTQTRSTTTTIQIPKVINGKDTDYSVNPNLVDSTAFIQTLAGLRKHVFDY